MSPIFFLHTVLPQPVTRSVTSVSCTGRRSVCPSIKVTVAEDRELQLNGGAKVATEHSIKNHTQDRGPH